MFVKAVRNDCCLIYPPKTNVKELWSSIDLSGVQNFRYDQYIFNLFYTDIDFEEYFSRKHTQ